ncbi:hypothetical protein FQR65_LT04604 [Abscondita terminalis]|nr:hypothetical protein FQR65_LT04604 [Abscondita terminalis]
MEEEYALKRDQNPRETAGLFSVLTFLYAVPIFLKGRKKEYCEDDVYETLSRDKSDVLGEQVEKLWFAELNKSKENGTVPSVRNVLMKLQRYNLAKIFIGYTLNELIFRPGQVIFLGYIVSHYLDVSKNTVSIPYFHVAGLLLSSLGSLCVIQLTLLEGLHTGMDIRIAACCLIYQKALKLNQSAFGETTVGQMINLLSNDVGVFDRAITLYQLIYISPIQLVIFTVMLYLEMGVSSLVGMSVLIIFIPLQSLLGKLSAKYRLKTATRTDSRVRLMDEIIRGIEIIKMYAWEKSFAKLVAHYRRMEIKSLTKSSYIKGSFLIYFLYISVPLFLTTLSYVCLGNIIDAKKVFFTTALFNSLAFNMGTFFPQAIALLNEIKVSSNRIGKFLLLDEVHSVHHISDGPPIQLQNVTAKWSKNIENTLTKLNMVIEEGSLVAVVGPVGSGKSSLLQSLLGEITLTSGKLLLNGTVSYASQDSWIFNNSVRQNILFGNRMNEIRYKKVVEVCALLRDLKMFISGDKMIVGEQGSSLSGGQKARVNLARAVYRDADIYLLDDPLSAVDVNVGKHIFDDCIRDFLKKKTVILVTHQLQYLQQVDRIIVLENGHIKADGSFEQLQKLKIDFVKLFNRDSDDKANDDGLTVAMLVITMLRNTLSFKFCMISSTHLHDSMFESIVHATMQFFNENSPGRILNRFTKDMGVVDELLPYSLAITSQTLISIIGILIVTCVVNPWLIIPSVIILIASNYVKAFYLSSSLNIKRLEGVTKSPVFGHLHATLKGLTTIRSFGAEEILKTEFYDKQDLHSCANFMFLSINRGLSYLLDLISLLYLTVITLVVVIISGESYGGNIGLAITQALQLLVQFQWGIRQLTDLENYMTSVERVLEYNCIDHERALTKPDKLDSSWPSLGTIVFENVYLSYSPNEFVLKNLNFTIQPEEKVGIVGRTGAGKSSIISSIFQLFDIEGKITIDGVDINTIGLHDLRKQISIIPQNPVMFVGSMRKNLDPFDERTDDELWRALDDVKMKEAVQALDMGLQMEISEGGLNLSVGQRQLICLARAIIRNNKILILDEATANVDPQTDAVIQDTIRKKFSRCTVLTIAHRLQTILDSDRILVMDAGEVVEFDCPNVLLKNPDGVFYKMVRQVDKNIILNSEESCNNLNKKM